MGSLTIERQCPSCHETNTVTVDEDALEAWRSGTHIQNAMPDLSPDQRELLMTGICGACWDKLFKEDEED